VINLVHVSGPAGRRSDLQAPGIRGDPFHGQYGGVPHSIWRTIGENLPLYRSYPRIVGETGGKDFVLAHPGADPFGRGHRPQPGELRVPGAEVQRGQPGLHPRKSLAQVKKELLADLAEHSAWATHAISATSSGR
jgi:1-pyrroline-5-carboxylate dehydrogenase